MTSKKLVKEAPKEAPKEALPKKVAGKDIRDMTPDEYKAFKLWLANEEKAEPARLLLENLLLSLAVTFRLSLHFESWHLFSL